MKEHATRRSAAALALAVCSLLTTGCHTASPQPLEMIADSISGFSSKQGANGWSYGYWDRTADPDKSYSQTTDFQLLKHFGSDPHSKSATAPGRPHRGFAGPITGVGDLTVICDQPPKRAGAVLSSGPTAIRRIP